MRLLLTSAGLTNSSIEHALLDLVWKPFEETNVVFVPTAMSMVRGNKNWFILNLTELQKQWFASLDIVDFAAIDKQFWLPAFQEADVLVFSGGHNLYLQDMMEQHGLLEELENWLLDNKVYVGISAWSIVCAPDWLMSNPKKKADYEATTWKTFDSSLWLVDFYFRPHYGNDYFPHSMKPYLEDKAKLTDKLIYALDDDGALKIDGDQLEIVSEGDYLILNN